MKLFGAVLIVGPAGTGHRGYIAGDALPGSGANEQSKHNAHVFERGDDLLHTGDGYMDARHGSAHAAIAFVGNEDKCASLGDDEVGSCDAHVGSNKLLAELPARFLGQVVNT